ncbi:MAG: hypothetical protein WC477_01820 [Patescibacteria group bacterium]
MQWKADMKQPGEGESTLLRADETLSKIHWASHISRASSAHEIAIFSAQGHQRYFVGLHWVNGHTNTIRSAQEIVGDRFGIYTCGESASVYARLSNGTFIPIKLEKIVLRKDVPHGIIVL